MPTVADVARIASARGYRVTEDGHVLNPRGAVTQVRRLGNRWAPGFNVNWRDDDGQWRSCSLPVHRFAAFCWFGEAAFAAEAIRHRDGDVWNFRRSNIALGTNSENELDKPAAVRAASARSARAAQGFRAHNARFSPEMVRVIRTERASGRPLRLLASEYGVTVQAISLIARGINYGDVGLELPPAPNPALLTVGGS